MPPVAGTRCSALSNRGSLRPKSHCCAHSPATKPSSTGRARDKATARATRRKPPCRWRSSPQCPASGSQSLQPSIPDSCVTSAGYSEDSLSQFAPSTSIHIRSDSRLGCQVLISMWGRPPSAVRRAKLDRGIPLKVRTTFRQFLHAYCQFFDVTRARKYWVIALPTVLPVQNRNPVSVPEHRHQQFAAPPWQLYARVAFPIRGETMFNGSRPQPSKRQSVPLCPPLKRF